MSPPANDTSSEPVALTALEINGALGITDNIPESSFGTVNSKLIAAGKRDNDVRAVAREASWPQVPNPGWIPKSERAEVNCDEREQHQDRDGRMQLTTRRKS